MSAPPHNLEAEQALLGAILFDNGLYSCITPQLAARHFYDPVHGRIFAACSTMIAAGELADGVTLRERFTRDGGIKEIGGADYLLQLLESAAPLSAQAQSYAALIYDLALRRELIRVGGVIADLAENPPDGHDAADIIEEAERTLTTLGDSFGGVAGASLSEAADALLASMDAPHVSTGFPALDRRIGGLFPADLIVLAGRPSMGKTTVATQLARNVAAQGRAVHFASLDMAREQVAARAISAASRSSQYGMERIEYFHLRPGSKVDRDLIRRWARELDRSILIDDTAAQSLAHLEASARASRRQLGRLDLIVVDYLQLMRAVRSDGRNNEVGEISAGLKAIAKRLKCPVLALSQLSRGVESRENKRPTLSDLRDSGAIEQDADIVIGVYREAYYLERNEPSEHDVEACLKRKAALDRCRHDIELITLKQRQGPIGTDHLTAHLPFDTVRDTEAA